LPPLPPPPADIDKAYARELAPLAGLDLHAHATGMLDAKAEIGHLSPAELVLVRSLGPPLRTRAIDIEAIENAYMYQQRPVIVCTYQQHTPAETAGI
jgi:hypothetical protein